MAGDWLSYLGAALQGGLQGYQVGDDMRRRQQSIDDERNWRTAQVNERKAERANDTLQQSHRLMQQLAALEGQGRGTRAVISKMRPELATAFEGMTDRDLGSMNDSKFDALLRYTQPPKPEEKKPPRFEVRSDPTSGKTYRLNLDTLESETFNDGGKPLTLTPRPRAEPRPLASETPQGQRKDRLAELGREIDDARSMATAAGTMADRSKYFAKADSLINVREQVQRGDGQAAPTRGAPQASGGRVQLDTTTPQRTPEEQAFEQAVNKIRAMMLPEGEKQQRIAEATRRFNAQRGQ